MLRVHTIEMAHDAPQIPRWGAQTQMIMTPFRTLRGRCQIGIQRTEGLWPIILKQRIV
jgi:hypothetical protein